MGEIHYKWETPSFPSQNAHFSGKMLFFLSAASQPLSKRGSSSRECPVKTRTKCEQPACATTPGPLCPWPRDGEGQSLLASRSQYGDMG